MLLATQHNARLHLLASFAVFFGGLLLEISRFEWIAVVLAIGLVASAEALNTAVERLGDAITRDKNPLIRDAKDVAAAGVLLASVAALFVAVFVFTPRLFTLFVAWGGAA